MRHVRHLVQLLTLLLSLAYLPQLQAQFTTPGNGGEFTATLRYIRTGQACAECPVTWQLVPPTQINVQNGYHYHPATGAPTGSFTHVENQTDANGNAHATWTSELYLQNGYPTGYAMSYAVSACSPVSQTACAFVNVRALYSGLSTASVTNGWFKTSDSAHNSQNYACSYQFCQEFNQIAANYYNSNSHKFVMVTAMSLPLGGIYDRTLFIGGTYWQNFYQNPFASYESGVGGEDHMYGDEADISLAGLNLQDVAKLGAAISATPGFAGRACEHWVFGNQLHVYCGGLGPGE